MGNLLLIDGCNWGGVESMPVVWFVATNMLIIDFWYLFARSLG